MQPDLALDHQLCFALYAASRRVQQAYRPALDDLGLTYPQYLVMLALWERDGVGVGELGERLHLDSGTLSPLLRRLEQRGLVTRRRDDPDGRRVEILLTPQGDALRDRAGQVQDCLAGQVDLGPEQLGALRDLARALVNSTPRSDGGTP
ncbi:MarR family winged helix-turn-helix transcriptional regulator [Agilicoccus flavus]|uniref:MarR family winged helix-turn-helix transcriptional regulator n=1 Tax=Agilicoccus flavus TaxID=2775968 RepID=UPI0027DA97FC|nr:MarR family transcriptional regulator [Agilicoccus flavus]